MTNSGKLAEDRIAALIEGQGSRILERNYSTRYGEIDIIYVERESGDLVFAEVKFREDSSCGYPYEYVTKYKIEKIESCAEHFIAFCKYELPEYMRIDVFSVLGNGEIEHFKNITG